MIKYTVRTIAGYFKLECDLRDFEEALRIVRKRSEKATPILDAETKPLDGIIKREIERADKAKKENKK